MSITEQEFRDFNVGISTAHPKTASGGSNSSLNKTLRPSILNPSNVCTRSWMKWSYPPAATPAPKQVQGGQGGKKSRYSSGVKKP